MKVIKHQTGVTLLELLTALAIFSLIMIMGYQGIVQLSYNQRYIEDAAQNQTQQALAHRTLRQALETRASLIGTSTEFSLNLQSSDSPYFAQKSSQTFVIADNTLSTYFDLESESTVLLRDIENASFGYVSHHVDQPNSNRAINGNSNTEFVQNSRAPLWQAKTPPALIELSWQKDGQLNNWLFATK